jgi:hypothetical protein
MGGSYTELYPRAYEYFEKRRMAERKKKGVRRLKTEAAFPRGIFSYTVYRGPRRQLATKAARLTQAQAATSATANRSSSMSAS